MKPVLDDDLSSSLSNSVSARRFCPLMGAYRRSSLPTVACIGQPWTGERPWGCALRAWAPPSSDVSGVPHGTAGLTRLRRRWRNNIW